MSRAPFAAWRFHHPDFDASRPEGLSLSPKGGVEMVSGKASVRQAVLLLLTTRPGERIMRPTYGCELDRLLFMPCDDTTAGLAIHYVRQALLRWEPRIRILELDARSDPEVEGRLNVFLKYQVRATLLEDRIELALDLLGDGN